MCVKAVDDPVAMGVVAGDHDDGHLLAPSAQRAHQTLLDRRTTQTQVLVAAVQLMVLEVETLAPRAVHACEHDAPGIWS